MTERRTLTSALTIPMAQKAFTLTSKRTANNSIFSFKFDQKSTLVYTCE